MAVTPKVWSLAYKKQQGMLPQFSQPQTTAPKNNNIVVSWWPQATAQALQNATRTASTPMTPKEWSLARQKNQGMIPQFTGLQPKWTQAGQTATPTPTTPTLPVFWTPASQQNTTNPTYLDTRNTDLAKQYGTQWLKTQDQVMAELLKNQDFATASETDRNTTATKIFKKMNVWQTTEPVQVKTDDMASDNKQYATTQEAEADNPRTQNLSAEEKIRYNMMDDIEKKQFINYGRADLRNALQYLARRKETRDYNEERGKSTLKQQELSDTNASIQSWQRLRQSEDNLNKLKANVKYLGTMGAPWVSMTKMDAINGQITEAQRVFDELREMEKNSREMRELWYGDLSAQIERQMVLLQDDLDDKVNKSIQNAFSMMSAEEIKGWLDTVEEIDAFRTKLMTNLDNSIGALTDDNIKARQFLIERYDVMAKEQTARIEEYKKNANTVNMDMSTAQWYYVDWNWTPIISMATWQPIVMPQKPPMDPTFSKETGELITFSTGANGQMVANVQKVTSGTGWAGGKIETIYGTDEYGNETKTSVMVMPDWSIRAIWWGNIWGGNTWSPSNQPISNVDVPPVPPQVIETNIQQIQTIKDWTQKWQCWTFVNDYLKTLWLWRLFIDPISKPFAKDWEIPKADYANSDVPTLWSIFITDSQQFPQYWHVGIVTKVNADGSFETKESNKAWEWQVFSRTMQPWEAKYWFFDPRLGKQAWQEQPQGQPLEMTSDMIISFNDDVTRRKMPKQIVRQIADAKKEVMSNKDSSISDILAWSNGWKSVGETQSKSLIKFEQAMWQLGAIQSEIKDMKTWPIIWALKKLNPYDTDAQILKAQLTWLIPNLARWVYGEVWVLTDQDIQLYAKTIPNLTSTKAVNKWVLAFTLDVIAWWYKNQLTSLAWQWYDVSWLEGVYNNIKWQADALREELGIKSDTTNVQNNNIWVQTWAWSTAPNITNLVPWKWRAGGVWRENN